MAGFSGDLVTVDDITLSGTADINGTAFQVTGPLWTAAIEYTKGAETGIDVYCEISESSSGPWHRFKDNAGGDAPLFGRTSTGFTATENAAYNPALGADATGGSRRLAFVAGGWARFVVAIDGVSSSGTVKLKLAQGRMA